MQRTGLLSFPRLAGFCSPVEEGTDVEEGTGVEAGSALKRAIPNVAGLVLGHGSGSGPDHPVLTAIAEQLAPLPVLRITFPYRALGGKRPPNPMPALVESFRSQRSGWAEALDLDPDSLLLGGRSLGARVASIDLAAGGSGCGLLAVSYPVHPPRAPLKLRTEHLHNLTVPSLWISGSRDPFGTPEELVAAAQCSAGPHDEVILEGGNHELQGLESQTAEAVSQWLLG